MTATNQSDDREDIHLASLDVDPEFVDCVDGDDALAVMDRIVAERAGRPFDYDRARRAHEREINDAYAEHEALY